MNVFVFPGQGSQFRGMGRELYTNSNNAKELFDIADETLGFSLSSIMFDGSDEDLKQTKVTQPAIFVHSIAKFLEHNSKIKPDFVAGHSLGEFSALVASNALDFESGLKLVAQRAKAMQKACELTEGTMAAVLGLENEVVEAVCKDIEGVVVAANYNCPGQLVISGGIEPIHKACELLKEKGARRALVLPVGGAFHSPLMEPAREQLASAIENTVFKTPSCPIYQNTTATAVTETAAIKTNLMAQLTAPVKWSQTIEQMINDGAKSFTEVGPGNVLQGLVRKINRDVNTAAAIFEN